MTEDEKDALYERISERVHQLVDELTEYVSRDDDDDIRQRLTEQFRFWRRS